jgi:Protein of unknown function (DUF2587)
MPIRSSDQEPEPEAQEPQQVPMILPPAQAPAVEQPAKLIRIAAMIRELLQDVRQSTPDEAGRKRLRDVYGRAVNALSDAPSESEIRLAQAQLVGWLEGLFQGIQAALWTQHMQARAEIDEMRRHRGLPPGPGEIIQRDPGQYL